MNNLSKSLRPRSWRTVTTHNQYLTEREQDVETDSCPLCSAPSLAEYTHWRKIPNKYPHDAVAETHDMIVPKSHTLEKDLSDEAKAELYQLKYETLNHEYVFIMEALPGAKSVPGHFHLHLIVPKVIDA